MLVVAVEERFTTADFQVSARVIHACTGRADADTCFVVLNLASRTLRSSIVYQRELGGA